MPKLAGMAAAASGRSAFISISVSGDFRLAGDAAVIKITLAGMIWRNSFSMVSSDLSTSAEPQAPVFHQIKVEPVMSCSLHFSMLVFRCKTRWGCVKFHDHPPRLRSALTYHIVACQSADMALTSDRNPFFGSGLDGLGETPISTDVAAVDNLLRLCPAAAATPLHDKAADAARMGLGSLHVKDERQRMGMGSFKALGAAFVIAREADAARRKAGDDLAWEETLRGRVFLTASAGNHGFRWWRGRASLVRPR